MGVATKVYKMTNKSGPVPPMVMWAQRPNLIILTICVEDCKDPEIKVESDKLIFKGVGGPEKKQHELTINFFKDIDTEKTKYAVRDRVIEFALEKKDGEGPYWKRLVKEEKKQHWLKVDFNKWRDEDEADDVSNGWSWWCRRYAWYGRYARYAGYGWYAWHARYGRYAGYARYGRWR